MMLLYKYQYLIEIQDKIQDISILKNIYWVPRDRLSESSISAVTDHPLKIQIIARPWEIWRRDSDISWRFYENILKS